MFYNDIKTGVKKLEGNILGENLTRLRKYREFTRDKVTEITEIPKFTYRSWEYGRYEPNVDQLIILSKLYNVSIDELVGNVKSEKYDFLETI